MLKSFFFEANENILKIMDNISSSRYGRAAKRHYHHLWSLFLNQIMCIFHIFE